MTNIRQQVYRDFPGWAVEAVVKIYDNRPGSWATVDQVALAKILDQFPDVSEKAKDNLRSYAMFATR
jgi:hypothetical protein